jgi:hypothetical protein
MHCYEDITHIYIHKRTWITIYSELWETTVSKAYYKIYHCNWITGHLYCCYGISLSIRMLYTLSPPSARIVFIEKHNDFTTLTADAINYSVNRKYWVVLFLVNISDIKNGQK